MAVTVTLTGRPVPASRPRVFKGGVSYTKPHRDYQKAITPTIAANKPASPYETPVSVTMEFVFPRYKTSDYPTYRADLDNLAKIPMDVMTKQDYWTDDNLVTNLKLTKRFANDNEAPHTIIEISGTSE